MKKRFIAILAIALAVCTCLPLAVHAAEKIEITSAASDNPSTNGAAATAECAVENLRVKVEGGLWYMGDCSKDTVEGSDAAPNTRYLTLGLGQDADIESVKIQWYQGDTGKDDGYKPAATKKRNYQFRIEASADGKTYTKIYPTSGDWASSETGVDFETYSCTFTGAKFVRIVGSGSINGVYDKDDPKGNYSAGERDNNSDKYFAIRNIEVYGTGKGGSGGNAGSSSIEPKADTTGGSSGTSGNTSGGTSSKTGDFENIVIFAGIAVVACAAVVIIRKKIRER